VRDVSASVVVLGQRGLARDIVRHALGVAGITTVDLVSLHEDPEGSIVAVLVSPAEEDWAKARQLDAGIVLVCEGPIDRAASVDLLLRGADAVVESEVELDELIEVVAMVAAGESFLTPQQAAEALDRLRRAPQAAAGMPTLTPRELDILVSIDRGDVVKQTARQLAISEKTVQNIQSRLFRKLGARNRAQAVARAHEVGLLPAVTVSIPD
jgi:DNA-binding CsgD family transcriptional regulator